MDPRVRWSPPFVVVVVFLGYLAGSELAFRLNDALDLQAALFLPAGLTVGALLRLRTSLWPAVLVAAAAAELTQDLRAGLSVLESAGFVAANTLEPLLGAALLTAVLGTAVDLGRLRHVAAYLLCAVAAGPAVGAIIGALTDRALGGDDLVRTMWQWWLGDALGVLLLGTLLLTLGTGPERRSLRSPWGVLLMAGSAAITVVVFLGSDLPLAFLVLLGVVVAGAQLGTRAVAVTSLIVAGATAISLGIDHEVLLAGMDNSTAVQLMKVQLGFFTAAGLVVAAEVSEREIAIATATRLAAETEAERELVDRLQRLLLPPPQLDGEHFTAHGIYLASSHALGVGGDWYDVAELEDGTVFVSVGDVVGRGAEAATTMGRLRAVLALLAAEDPEPGAVLRRLDRAAPAIPGAFCATTWVGRFDPADATLTYAAAGHLPGFLVDAAGAVVRLDADVATPIGVEPHGRTPGATVTVVCPATLVLFTDGLVERRGEDLQRSLARLAVVLAATGGDPERIIDAVGHGEADDDTVLLVVQLRGDTPGPEGARGPEGTLARTDVASP